MTSFPSLPPSVLSAATQQAQTAVALGAKATELLAKMAVGQQIAATVTGQLGNGMVEIATPQGNFQLRLPVPVPDGAQLLLQQMPAGQLRLLAVNGQPPVLPGQPATGLPNPAGLLIATLDTAPAQGGHGNLQDLVQIGARPTGGPTPGSTPGSPPGLQATVISIPPAGMTQPGVTPLPMGAIVTLRLAEVTPGPATPAQPPLAPAAAAPAPPTQSSSMPAPASAASPTLQTAPAPAAATVLPSMPGSAARPLPPALPNLAAAPSGNAPPPLPPQIRGEVLAGHYGNRPVIATPLGTIALDAAIELPPGGNVTVEILRAQPPAAAAAPVMRGDAPAAGQPFAALGNAIEVLRQTAPAEAEALVKALPQAGPRLAMALIAQVQALRTGDSRGTATGGAVRALDAAGQKDAAKRLLGEFEESSAQARATGGEWRAHAVPFLNGAEIEEIQLYTRPPPQEADADGQRGGTGRDDGARFLVNVAMSRLGPMQLDGLVRRDSKRFDLIIRTQEALPPEMRTDIAGLFAEACALSGVAGQVAFQAGRPFVAVEALPGQARGMIV